MADIPSPLPAGRGASSIYVTPPGLTPIPGPGSAGRGLPGIIVGTDGSIRLPGMVPSITPPPVNPVPTPGGIDFRLPGQLPGTQVLPPGLGTYGPFDDGGGLPPTGKMRIPQVGGRLPAYDPGGIPGRGLGTGIGIDIGIGIAIGIGTGQNPLIDQEAADEDDRIRRVNKELEDIERRRRATTRPWIPGTSIPGSTIGGRVGAGAGAAVP